MQRNSTSKTEIIRSDSIYFNNKSYKIKAILNENNILMENKANGQLYKLESFSYRTDKYDSKRLKKTLDDLANVDQYHIVSIKEYEIKEQEQKLLCLYNYYELNFKEFSNIIILKNKSALDELTNVIKNLIKGLAFLYDNNIILGSIEDDNIVYINSTWKFSNLIMKILNNHVQVNRDSLDFSSENIPSELIRVFGTNEQSTQGLRVFFKDSLILANKIIDQLYPKFGEKLFESEAGLSLIAMKGCERYSAFETGSMMRELRLNQWNGNKGLYLEILSRKNLMIIKECSQRTFLVEDRLNRNKYKVIFLFPRSKEEIDKIIEIFTRLEKLNKQENINQHDDTFLSYDILNYELLEYYDEVKKISKSLIVIYTNDHSTTLSSLISSRSLPALMNKIDNFDHILKFFSEILYLLQEYYYIINNLHYLFPSLMITPDNIYFDYRNERYGFDLDYEDIIDPKPIEKRTINIKSKYWDPQFSYANLQKKLQQNKRFPIKTMIYSIIVITLEYEEACLKNNQNDALLYTQEEIMSFIKKKPNIFNEKFLYKRYNRKNKIEENFFNDLTRYLITRMIERPNYGHLFEVHRFIAGRSSQNYHQSNNKFHKQYEMTSSTNTNPTGFGNKLGSQEIIKFGIESPKGYSMNDNVNVTLGNMSGSKNFFTGYNEFFQKNSIICKTYEISNFKSNNLMYLSDVKNKIAYVGKILQCNNGDRDAILNSYNLIRKINQDDILKPKGALKQGESYILKYYNYHIFEEESKNEMIMNSYICIIRQKTHYTLEMFSKIDSIIPFSYENFLNLITHTFLALTTLHKNGIYHVNIKPSNIFFDNQSTFYLGDLDFNYPIITNLPETNFRQLIEDQRRQLACIILNVASDNDPDFELQYQYQSSKSNHSVTSTMLMDAQEVSFGEFYALGPRLSPLAARFLHLIFDKGRWISSDELIEKINFIRRPFVNYNSYVFKKYMLHEIMRYHKRLRLSAMHKTWPDYEFKAYKISKIEAFNDFLEQSKVIKHFSNMGMLKIADTLYWFDDYDTLFQYIIILKKTSGKLKDTIYLDNEDNEYPKLNIDFLSSPKYNNNNNNNNLAKSNGSLIDTESTDENKSIENINESKNILKEIKIDIDYMLAKRESSIFPAYIDVIKKKKEQPRYLLKNWTEFEVVQIIEKLHNIIKCIHKHGFFHGDINLEKVYYDKEYDDNQKNIKWDIKLDITNFLSYLTNFLNKNTGNKAGKVVLPIDLAFHQRNDYFNIASIVIKILKINELDKYGRIYDQKNKSKIHEIIRKCKPERKLLYRILKKLLTSKSHIKKLSADVKGRIKAYYQSINNNERVSLSKRVLAKSPSLLKIIVNENHFDCNKLTDEGFEQPNESFRQGKTRIRLLNTANNENNNSIEIKDLELLLLRNEYPGAIKTQHKKLYEVSIDTTKDIKDIQDTKDTKNDKVIKDIKAIKAFNDNNIKLVKVIMRDDIIQAREYDHNVFKNELLEIRDYIMSFMEGKLCMIIPFDYIFKDEMILVIEDKHNMTLYNDIIYHKNNHIKYTMEQIQHIFKSLLITYVILEDNQILYDYITPKNIYKIEQSTSISSSTSTARSSCVYCISNIGYCNLKTKIHMDYNDKYDDYKFYYADECTELGMTIQNELINDNNHKSSIMNLRAFGRLLLVLLTLKDIDNTEYFGPYNYQKIMKEINTNYGDTFNKILDMLLSYDMQFQDFSQFYNYLSTNGVAWVSNIATEKILNAFIQLHSKHNLLKIHQFCRELTSTQLKDIILDSFGQNDLNMIIIPNPEQLDNVYVYSKINGLLIYYGGMNKDKQRNGNGYEFLSYEIYYGEYTLNQRNGKGKVYNLINGEYYIGEFVKGKKCGYGCLYGKYGEIIYEGNWKDDQIWMDEKEQVKKMVKGEKEDTPLFKTNNTITNQEFEYDFESLIKEANTNNDEKVKEWLKSGNVNEYGHYLQLRNLQYFWNNKDQDLNGYINKEIDRIHVFPNDFLMIMLMNNVNNNDDELYDKIKYYSKAYEGNGNMIFDVYDKLFFILNWENDNCSLFELTKQNHGLFQFTVYAPISKFKTMNEEPSLNEIITKALSLLKKWMMLECKSKCSEDYIRHYYTSNIENSEVILEDISEKKFKDYNIHICHLLTKLIHYE